MNAATRPPSTRRDAPPDARRARPVNVICWTATVLALLFLPCGVINNGDGMARYAQAKALVRGSLAIPPEFTVDRSGQPIGGILPGVGGRLYSKFGVGPSLLWALPTAAGVLAHRVAHVDPDLIAGFGISFINPVAVLLTALSLRHLLRLLNAGADAGDQVVPTLLLYLFGCSTLPYANTAFTEPLAGLLLLWAAALPVITTSAVGGLLSGLAVSGIVLVKPDLVLLAPCVALLYLRARPAQAASFAAAASLGVVVTLALNQVCRGSALTFSYGRESSQFQSPVAGLHGYLLGVDRNLLLFNPALAAAAIGIALRPANDRWVRLRRSVVAAWCVYLPFYAAWWAWAGGMCFGPRFLQTLVPVSMMFAGRPLGRRSPQWARVAAGAVAFAAAVLVPLQIAGTEVKTEEAAQISFIAGRTEVVTYLRLLTLKLRRGIRAPEVYRVSDFAAVPPGGNDPVLDFQSKRTFKFLHNWPAIAAANHLGVQVSPVDETRSVPPAGR